MTNTLLIIFVLGVRNVWNDRIVYETFSNTLKRGTYKIENIDDYLTFSDTVANGNTYLGCEIVLMNDLDFQAMKEIPVIGLEKNVETIFSGVFNGNGHTISGINIVNPNGKAAMFASVDGMILNLTLQESRFEGAMCGGFAAELKSNGVILNCRAEIEYAGEQSGALAGISRGYLFNCVGNGERLADSINGGTTEECYLENDERYHSALDVNIVLDRYQMAETLNKHLPRSGAFHGRTDMLLWSAENQLELTDKKAVLLEELLVEAQIDGKEIWLKAYYSHGLDHWSVAVPAGCENEQMTLIAKNTQGKREQFFKGKDENTILYTDGEYQYFIDFLQITDAETLVIDLNAEKTLEDVYNNKEEEVPAVITKIKEDGKTESEYLKAFYGHGNDSWSAEKKSFNLKFSENSNFLGLGADEDYALLAGYRDDSLMSYVTTTTFIQNLDFSYAPEFKLVHLYVEGEYLGVYFLVEKIEIDENRIHISSVYENMKVSEGDKLMTYSFQTWKDEDSMAERYFYDITNNPEDITGGYLLELDMSDYDATASRFVSERGNPLTLKRAHYSSERQVNYIADYWQEFEDALYSETGFNKIGKHYSEYIDLESFAKQWLLYEATLETSICNSVYFYKESDITGDGLLHACFPWDVEHSYLFYGHAAVDELFLKTTNGSNNYWNRYWQHEDFKEALRQLWENSFTDAFIQMVSEEPSANESDMKNLSWYEMHIENLSHMENSRWWKNNPLGRCDSIREFLKVRIEILSKLLYE